MSRKLPKIRAPHEGEGRGDGSQDKPLGRRLAEAICQSFLSVEKEIDCITRRISSPGSNYGASVEGGRGRDQKGSAQ